MNAERLGLLDPDPDVEVLVVPPHAAMNPLAVMAVTASTMRRGRKLVGLGRVIWFLSWHAVRPPSPQGVRSTPEETESVVREVDRKWGVQLLDQAWSHSLDDDAVLLRNCLRRRYAAHLTWITRPRIRSAASLPVISRPQTTHFERRARSVSLAWTMGGVT